MELALRAAGVAAAGTAAVLLLRKSSAEAAALTAAAAAVLLLSLALAGALGIRDFILEMAEAAELSPALLSPVVKTVGIGLLTHITSGVCRDSGQSSAASAVETAGTVAAISAALPLMKTVFSMISSLI